jgi:Fe-S-cluster-containing dehydrogenase component
MAMVCRVCDDAPCVIICPRKALKQSAENGVILMIEGLCDGCGWCIPAYLYGAITMNLEKGVVMMCDLCGDEPICIDFCPEEALKLVTEETAVSWSSALEKLRLDADKAVTLLTSGKWNELFMKVHNKMRRLEEKLVALSEKELELQSKVAY